MDYNILCSGRTSKSMVMGGLGPVVMYYSVVVVVPAPAAAAP
uniref:Uncharacterized protein n=1 Tax=Setaria italica TaxID=4555 RepID=K4ANV1_SETIT